MKWIVYSAVIINQVTRTASRQVRRAPVAPGEMPTVVAELLGGTLLAIQPDAERAEGLRRLTEMQAFLAGQEVVEWCAPAEWENGCNSGDSKRKKPGQTSSRRRLVRVGRPVIRRRLVRGKAVIQRRRPRWH